MSTVEKLQFQQLFVSLRPIRERRRLVLQGGVINRAIRHMLLADALMERRILERLWSLCTVEEPPRRVFSRDRRCIATEDARELRIMYRFQNANQLQ